MELNLWKVTLGISLAPSNNDGGICIGVEFYKSPHWEVEFGIQALLPWLLAFRVAERVR